MFLSNFIRVFNVLPIGNKVIKYLNFYSFFTIFRYQIFYLRLKELFDQEHYENIVIDNMHVALSSVNCGLNAKPSFVEKK